MRDLLQTLFNRLDNNRMAMENENAVSLITLPEGYHVTDTEKYQMFRNRERGTFTTEDLKSFVGYVKDKGGADKIFIDTEDNRILLGKAVFNLLDDDGLETGQADDLAVLSVSRKPEFKDLVGFTDDYRLQDNVVDFLIDHENRLSFSVDGDEISYRDAVNAFRHMKVTVDSEATSERRDFATSKTAMEKIAIESESVIPDTIVMKTPVYDNLEMTDVKIRVITKVSNGEFKVMFKIIGLEDIYQERANTFKQLLSEQLANTGQSNIYVGLYHV